MSLFNQGQAAFRPESLTPARIGFSPVSVRFANLAPQDAATWGSAAGTATVSTGISAPDSTTDAATLACPIDDRAYRRIYATERTVSVGDWLICGVYVKASTLTQGANQPTGTMANFAAATLRILDDTEGYQIDIDGLNYRNLTASEDADTTWQWITTAAKIELAPSGDSATVALDLNCDPEHTVSFYAPTLWHIPADTLTDAEIQAQLLNFYPVPDAAEAGIVATLAGQSLQSKIRDAGGQVVDVRTRGAACNGVTDDTAVVQAAINDAEAGDVTVYLPNGTVNISSLTLSSSTTLIGAGKGKTILQSDGSDMPVLHVATNGNRLQIKGLTVQGTVTGGSNQHGIEIVGASPADIVIEDVDILTVGGRALYLNSPSLAIFSSVFKNITARNWNLANTAGVPAFDIDTDGPCVLFENCYPKETTSANAIGFRIRRGQTRTIKLESCNGIDPTGSDSTWAIVGQDTGLSDASGSVAYCTFSNCNIEAFTATGIEVRGSGSVVNFVGANNFTAGANGVRPIWYRSAVVAGASPGILDPQTIFANADTAGTTYANGQAIESEGIPPLLCLAPAGQFGSFSGWTTYWDTSTASDSVQPLRRLDALNRVAPTGSYTVESPGTRLVDVRHSGAGVTITLMYGGHLRPGEWVVVKDGAGIAGTHNVTVQAAGGSTIDGAGSKVITSNYGAIVVFSDGTNYMTWADGNASITGGADTALSNLASVAVNTSLLPGTDNAIDLGSGSKQWRTGYFGTSLVMASGATTVGGQNWTITGGTSPQYAFSDGTVSGRFQLVAGSYLQLGTTTTHNTLFLHNGTGVFTLRAVGLIPETTDTYQFGGDANRWTDAFLSGSLNLKERTAPSAPSANTIALYAKDKSGVSTLYYKKDDGTEVEIGSGGGGSGDVVGPGSATDNALARFDTTTGKLIQNSGVTLSDLSTSTYTLAVTAPSAASTSTAGYSLVSQASSAVAGTSTNGAAAGGNWSAIAGDAARLNTGDANGGNIYLTPGAKIGSGANGQVILGRVGTVGVPSLTWAGSLDSGISLINSGIQFSLSGTNNAAIGSNGFKASSNGRLDFSSDSSTSGTTDLALSRFAANTLRVGGDTAGSTAGKLFVSRSDKTHTGWLTVDGDSSNTSTVDNVGAIGLDSSGTAAAGFGAQLLLTLESSTTNQRQAAGMTWLWTTATDASRTADLYFSTVNAGSVAEAFRVVSSGAFRSAAISDPASPTNGDVWHSSARNCYSVRQSGQTEDFSTSLWRSSATASFDTTSAATSIIADTGVGTKTVAANRLKAGNQIRITAGGLYGTKASSAGTLTVRVTNGGTTMITAVFTLPDGVFDQVWSLEAVGAVNATGSSGTIYWRIMWLMTDASGLVYAANYATNSTTINTTASRTIDVTGQFSVSNIENYFQTDNACIEILA